MYVSLVRGTLRNKTCKEVGEVKWGRGPSLIDAVVTEASKEPMRNSLQSPQLGQGGWTWYLHQGGHNLGQGIYLPLWRKLPCEGKFRELAVMSPQ